VLKKASNFEAVMDDGLARAEDVMSSQRAHHARQTRKEKVDHNLKRN